MMKDIGNVVLANVKFNLLEELKEINRKINMAGRDYDKVEELFGTFAEFDKSKIKRDIIIEVLFDIANAELKAYVKEENADEEVYSADEEVYSAEVA